MLLFVVLRADRSLQFHLGLLRPSLFGWYRKVYSVRCEADVVYVISLRGEMRLCSILGK